MLPRSITWTDLREGRDIIDNDRDGARFFFIRLVLREEASQRRCDGIVPSYR